MADPVIRLDRRKPYATCHGERTPEDPHYLVHFWQGGKMGVHMVLLPFDAQGELVADDGKREPYRGMGFDAKGNSAEVTFQPLWTNRMRAYRDAKLKRMAALAAEAAPEIEEDEAPALDGPIIDEVDFRAWLRGQANYEPRRLRDAARRPPPHGFGRVFSTTPEMVVDLVLDEKLIPEDELAPHLKKHLPQAAA